MHALLKQAGYMNLATQIYLYAHPVKIEEGRFEFRPAPEASPALAQELTQALKAATGKRWMVSVSPAPGAPTMAESARAAQEEKFAQLRAHPLIKQVFEVFPDAELKAIHKKED
jgi:DNA polymerase-3 subunit gamma/tau